MTEAIIKRTSVRVTTTWISEDFMSSYNQNHSGSGHNIMNFGKQPFVMRPGIADQVVRVLRDDQRGVPLQVEAVGPERSVADAQMLVAMLRERGIQAEFVGYIMCNMPPNERAVEIDGTVIRVDSSK